MLDPIQITIVDVANAGDGVAIDCTWQWGDRPPKEITVLTGDWPESADEARAMVTAWVLDYAAEEHELVPLRTELMQTGWSITFDSEDDPFGSAEIAAARQFQEKSAGAINRAP